MADKPRRFIAGAVCPRCGLMDKIVVEAGGEERLCVNCGFTDARPEDAAQEPRTRVTRGAARRVETPAAVVRLVDPDAGD